MRRSIFPKSGFLKNEGSRQDLAETVSRFVRIRKNFMGTFHFQRNSTFVALQIFQISTTELFFFKIGIFPNKVFSAGSSRNDVQIRSNQTMLYGKISISAKFVGFLHNFQISATLKGQILVDVAVFIFKISVFARFLLTNMPHSH